MWWVQDNSAMDNNAAPLPQYFGLGQCEEIVLYEMRMSLESKFIGSEILTAAHELPSGITTIGRS